LLVVHQRNMQTDNLPDLDYRRLLAASRKPSAASPKPALKLALLSDAATQQFVPILKAILDRDGFSAEIYEGPFDAIELEAYDPSSRLYAFGPDVVVILNATQALRASFAKRNGSAANFADGFLEKTQSIWNAIQSRCSATVVQSNLALPLERHFGNYGLKVADSLYSVVHALNTGLAQKAREQNGVLLLDIEGVASYIGRKNFFDDRFWDMWKTFCSFDALPYIAQNLVDILMAMRGRVVKCMVLDLDNTLWGGVIGDDGLEGIKLSAHGEGEAWHRFQCFLKELKQRGILLAVCSKNDEQNALLPFQSHPEMVLKKDDITVFVANWNDKAENIRAIQQALNIGFDSMVFVDDNPFERNLVRELVPGIIVPELPDDPSEYVRFLCELNLFETTSFSSEDLQRAEMYKQEASRRAAAASYASVEEFLQSLDMRIVVSRFDSFHLPRIAQLIQRSNQFNLTTRRRSEAECERLMHDPDVFPLYVKLSDRLGDHGLISVVILQPDNECLEITDWMMSCRVLSRGVEQYVMNEVFAIAAKNGFKHVTGTYIPTAKNGMVRDFFRSFGFSQTADTPEATRWILAVESYVPGNTYIKSYETEAEAVA
jgi:FkbH-like protein